MIFCTDNNFSPSTLLLYAIAFHVLSIFRVHLHNTEDVQAEDLMKTGDLSVKRCSNSLKHYFKHKCVCMKSSIPLYDTITPQKLASRLLLLVAQEVQACPEKSK